MKLPQFTIWDLLLSTALIACGIAAPIIGSRGYQSDNPQAAILAIVGWFVAPVFIGAGIFLPFGRPLLGVVIFLLAAMVVGLML